jgi:hypothetical protein
MSLKERGLLVAHMAAVAELPCAICGCYPVELHHPRFGQGKSQRASDWLVIPLCITCHRGSLGLHGSRALWKIKKWDEMDALAWTIEQIAIRRNYKALLDG